MSTDVGNIVIQQMSRDYDNAILTLDLATFIPIGTVVTINIRYTGLLINKQETKEQGVGLTEFMNAKNGRQECESFSLKLINT